MAKGQGKGAAKGRQAGEVKSAAEELGLDEDAGHGGGRGGFSADTFTNTSKFPKTPFTSTTPAIELISEITSTSEPGLQFMRMYDIKNFSDRGGNIN